MYAVDLEEFEALVDSAVAKLPETCRDRIDNVSLQVRERASSRDLGLGGTEVGGTLLGVYRGIPLPHRNAGYNLVMPM